ncbi:sugar nucleotide-binding protein, partial [Candidatus Latescibacterota bacterium]
MTESRYKSILLTGSSGNLGQVIINSGLFQNLVAPSEHVLDITKPTTIAEHFSAYNFDAVIHCAALARMMICEKDPVLAIKSNIIGTGNLVNEVIEYEKKAGKPVRFIHISTDGVYPSTRGNYTEQDETIPYNKYGWTKLGAEC